MEKKELIIVGVALMIIFIASFFIFSMDKAQTMPEAQKIINKAIEQQKNIASLSTVTEKVQKVNANQMKTTETMNKNNSQIYLKIEYTGAVAEYYKNENAYYACYDNFGSGRECANVSNSTTLVKEMLVRMETAPDEKILNASSNYFGALFSTEAYKVISTGTEMHMDRQTNCVEMVIDYKKITSAQLIQMGIQPSNTLILNSENNAQKVCYDSETGYPLYSIVSYTLSGKNYSYESTVKSIDFEEKSIPEYGAGSINKVLKYKDDINNMIICSLVDSRDECLRNKAYEGKNPMFCAGISEDLKQKACYYYISSYTTDTRICDQFGTDAAKDDCSDNMARQNLNITACEHIQNSERKANCTEYVTKTIKEIEDNAIANAECFTDEDCHITGGLNQYCEPVNVTKNNTAYYHVYECLPPYKNYTSCSCTDYQCGWDRTEAYVSCYNNMSDLDDKEFIENYMNETKSANTTIIENQTTQQTKQNDLR